jgi:ferredoxin
MNMLLRRSPFKNFVNDRWRAEMDKIKNCRNCGLCRSRCPYGLDTPELLKYMLADYDDFYAAHKDL